MNFFKKVGRPSEDEQMLIDSIVKMAEEKGVTDEQLPDCHNIEDLLEAKSLLESYGETEEQEQADLNAEDEAGNDEGAQQDQPDVTTDNDIATEQESVNSEQVRQTTAPAFISDNYDPFSEAIIERSYTQQQARGPASEDPAGSNAEPDDLDGLQLEDIKAKNPLEDLNPATKRRAAEQTADALLKGYEKFAPVPFKWLSKISEDKVEKLTLNGELDPSLEVSDGMTYEEYMKQTNDQVDEIFKVEQETLDEIREPLIEVLMEQQLELTPTQRLMMAIFSHLAQMLTVALKLRQQNNRILSYQKHITALSRVKVA